MSVRTFWQIDPDEATIVTPWKSKSARDAALKAATRDESLICLVDVEFGKLHVFRGARRELAPEEQTYYTRQRNISHKPVVEKMGYHNCRREIKRSDVPEVARLFVDLLTTGG